MKREILAVGLLVALGAVLVARWAAPAKGEARMSLYRRHPWRQHVRTSERA
jgi:hypothetical protein